MSDAVIENSIPPIEPIKYGVGLTLLAGLPLFTLLPLGMDFFLPAVYQIGEHFGNQTVPAMAISIYMLFWGIGQLVWGGVADLIGKKTIALIGLVLFSISSYMITTAAPGESSNFLLYRSIQSFGGSACFTAIFALIRTRFDGAELNKSYSYLNGILAFIPVSAPLLGAYVLEGNPWAFLFTLMAMLGVASVVWVFMSIPKDQRTKATRQEGQAKQPILKSYWSVVRNSRFRSYLFFAVTAQMLFIYFLTVAPTYLIGKLGLSQIDFGILFMVISLIFMGMSFMAPKLTQWLSMRHIVGLALVLCALGGGLMFVLSEANAWYALIAPMVLIAVGCTILLSSCPANALADFKDNAGVASGLYTAMTFGVGSLISGGFANLFDSADLGRVALVYILSSLLALAVLTVNKTLRQTS